MKLSFPGPQEVAGSEPGAYEELQGKSAESQLKCARDLEMAPAVTIPGVRVGHSSSGEREQGLGS